MILTVYSGHSGFQKQSFQFVVLCSESVCLESLLSFRALTCMSLCVLLSDLYNACKAVSNYCFMVISLYTFFFGFHSLSVLTHKSLCGETKISVNGCIHKCSRFSKCTFSEKQVLHFPLTEFRIFFCCFVSH